MPFGFQVVCELVDTDQVLAELNAGRKCLSAFKLFVSIVTKTITAATTAESQMPFGFQVVCEMCATVANRRSRATWSQMPFGFQVVCESIRLSPNLSLMVGRKCLSAFKLFVRMSKLFGKYKYQTVKCRNCLSAFKLFVSDYKIGRYRIWG